MDREIKTLILHDKQYNVFVVDGSIKEILVKTKKNVRWGDYGSERPIFRSIRIDGPTSKKIKKILDL